MADQKWRSRVDWKVAGLKSTITRLQNEKAILKELYNSVVKEKQREAGRKSWITRRRSN